MGLFIRIPDGHADAVNGWQSDYVHALYFVMSWNLELQVILHYSELHQKGHLGSAGFTATYEVRIFFLTNRCINISVLVFIRQKRQLSKLYDIATQEYFHDEIKYRNVIDENKNIHVLIWIYNYSLLFYR